MLRKGSIGNVALRLWDPARAEVWVIFGGAVISEGDAAVDVHTGVPIPIHYRGAKADLCTAPVSNVQQSFSGKEKIQMDKSSKKGENMHLLTLECPL